MIKRIALASATTLLLISMPAQAGGHGSKKDNAKTQAMDKVKQSDSPFLIQKGLPHFTKLIMKNWDDKKLSLTPEQKEILLEVRKTTLGGIKKLKPAIFSLENDIRKDIVLGVDSKALQEKVNKLASLRAEATMVHLTCIEKTKATLNKDQLKYLMKKSKKNK